MKKYFCISIILLSGAVFIGGCKKEKKIDYDTASSQDDAQAESIFNEINDICNQAVEDGALSTHRFGVTSNNLLSSCATIVADTDSVTGAGNVTVDFGSYFCLGLDNKYRKGKINVSFTGHYKDPGTVVTINVTDFKVGNDSVNTTRITGERVVTNNGPDSLGRKQYGITVNATLYNYLNEKMTWNSIRTRYWAAGDSTPDRTDDEYLISGSSYGRSFAGVNFSSGITTALHVRIGCKWITEGKFVLITDGMPERHFDYGSGTCDNLATVTIEDKTFEISLR